MEIVRGIPEAGLSSASVAYSTGLAMEIVRGIPEAGLSSASVAYSTGPAMEIAKSSTAKRGKRNADNEVTHDDDG